MNTHKLKKTGPGRPKTKFEFDLLDPEESLRVLEKNVKQEKFKATVEVFGKRILRNVTEPSSIGTQTQPDIDSICEIVKDFDEFEKCFLMANIMSQLSNEEKVNSIFLLYNDLEYEQQCDMFALLGNSLNQEIYETSTMKSSGQDLTIEDLKDVSKLGFYQECEGRLKNFIDHLTARKKSTNENTNYKANIFENMLKARNSKYLSGMGIKEHMVTYLSSGKSVHTSQVFSKQGGKGTRPLLEKVLKNSESVCKFKAPEHVTLLFSYDNIQTLLKTHRIGGAEQKKILTIVVCSILCLMPDGEQLSQIQYSHKNTPANWYSEYTFEPEKKVFIEDLNATTLKECLNLEKEEMDIFNEIFEKDLEDALEFVKNDIDENNQDSIDHLSKSTISKKRKLCTEGHINDNVKSNRKICDRQFCKSLLKEGVRHEPPVVCDKKNFETRDKQQEKANLYLNVPNIYTENIPKEVAVGAIAVNPNTSERISKVLDETLEAANMKNTYSVKIVLSGNKVTKVFDEDQNTRKFIVVTADGLPYKIMMDLIKNEHKCAVCGKRIEFLADMTDHMHKTGHCEFFQTYGNILPNIGHFHYSLTMLRSLVKLQWNIDFQELVKSIHFVSPKALFSQEKVTDYHKS